MQHPAKSKLLVAGQLGAIAALLLTGPIIPGHGPAIALFALGGALGVWAWLTMGSTHLRVVPDPHPDGRLLTHGPYRWIRHPMYTCTLLLTASWLWTDPTPLRCAIWILLWIDLIAKLQYEEAMLLEIYPDYLAYRRETRRLIPFLF